MTTLGGLAAAEQMALGRAASEPRMDNSFAEGALLAPQPEPDCTFKTDDPNADERQKLDYERQCFRHAEMIVRNRLQSLQEAFARQADVTSKVAGTSTTERRSIPASAEIEDARRLVDIGDRHMAQGNIAIAREYFTRAADLGLASAAMKMAETQDPRELARWNVRGVKPDLAEAKRWYQKALELKASEAEARLRRLSSQ